MASSGTGSVVSSRVVQRSPNGLSGEAVSYTIAIVALDEGPWVYTSLEGDVPTVSDEPIRVQFRPSTPGERFPVFGVCAA
ncbi:MAG: OB-fold domain-containing protein [Rhodococcus sp. (in: high G+C Gram-positive bacteria)]|uniref:OB-fold domain-containing protein n=1 Tax=Rhodococcus sp. TaxID=1831 RepID=UPI003BAF506E